jgi:galactitol-specific phosphotransferase system IIB component
MYNGKMTENKEKLKQQLWSMNQKLNKDHIQIAGKHILLRGMQVKIEQLQQEIFLYRSGESCKKIESNKFPSKADLIFENANLKKKLKDLENDKISFNLEILDALDEVKHQIQSERKVKSAKNLSRKGEEQDTRIYRQRVGELEEQVRDTREKIQKFREAGKGFEHFSVEDDPAGPNCKCLIY